MKYLIPICLALASISINANAMECHSQPYQATHVYYPNIWVECSNLKGQISGQTKLKSILLEIRNYPKSYLSDHTVSLTCKINSPSLTIGEYHWVSTVTNGGSGPSHSSVLVRAAKDEISKNCPGTATDEVLKTVTEGGADSQVTIFYGKSFEIDDATVMYDNRTIFPLR